MPVTLGCIFWLKLGPNSKSMLKEDFWRKLTNVTFVNLLCPIMLKSFKKSLCDRSLYITLNKFGRNWSQIAFSFKRGFFGKLTNTTILHLLCPIMLQCLKKEILKVGHVMRYKMLQFWVNLDTDHPFTLKGNFFEKLIDVNFVYFIYPIITLKCLKKSLNGSQNTRLHNFWTN